MKWLLLLLMACAAAAIFYFRNDIRDMFEEGTSSGDGKPPEGEVVTSGEGADKSGTTTPGSGSGSGTDGKRPGDKPPVKPAIPKPAGDEDEIAERYPMPKFKTLEDAVGNWNAIPPSAFGREVTVSEPVKLVLPGGVGSTNVPANSKLFAVNCSRDLLLTVSRSIGAASSGQIHIDQTDFKQILGREFDAWKARQTDAVMNKRARARRILANTPPVARPKPGAPKAPRNAGNLRQFEAELGPVPQQRPDGTVPLMVASIKRGDVTEIKLDIIDRWGPVIREVVDGEAYWTASVSYVTHSMFGAINTEAQALMRHGKVESWVYTGSGESVP